MSAHSPGPWRWEDFRKDDGTWHLRDADGDSVLRVRDVGEAFSMPGQAEPDARLIAAAPELYAAVVVLVAAIKMGAPQAALMDSADRCMAIIARIDGGTP